MVKLPLFMLTITCTFVVLHTERISVMKEVRDEIQISVFHDKKQ